MNNPVKVIYVVGVGHSGSTLLDLLLGSHSRIESLGEMEEFDRYMSREPSIRDARRTCTCGARYKECEFWRKVTGAAMAACQCGELVLGAADQSRFEQHNYAVFRAALDVSGKDLVCDSSKNYLRLRRLLQSDLFDIFVVHLVRDGRAVGYSAKRKGRRPDPDKPGRRLYWGSLKNWRRKNIACSRMLRDYGRSIRLRYEDLVANPELWVSRILAGVGLDLEKGQLEFWNTVHHNIGGNHMRHLGRQEIRQDTEYLSRLSGLEWWLGTALAWEPLRRFGYPSRRPPAPPPQ